MQNRRQCYRHPISPARDLRVSFSANDGTVAFAGAMVDLSIGGLCVRADTREALAGKSWTATFALEAKGTLAIPVEPVHAHEGQPGQYGFRFLPRVSPRLQEDQERTIWSYLLDEQRSERRQARPPKNGKKAANP